MQYDYEYLIFDADHTLIDFYADERAAFRRTFQRYGAAFTEADIEACRRLSDSAWADAGLNDVHLPAVQDVFHTRYFSHLPGLIERIKKVVPMSGTNEEIAEYFVGQLHVSAIPLGEALSTFKRLSEKYKTCIATNGITKMQQARLAEFLPYTYRLFVSQELGTIKPNTGFFNAMVKSLKTDVEKCLFIGDSFSSDVAGCNAVGMDCIWLNPLGQKLPENLTVKAEIARVEQLLAFL